MTKRLPVAVLLIIGLYELRCGLVRQWTCEIRRVYKVYRPTVGFSLKHSNCDETNVVGLYPAELYAVHPP